MNWGALMGGLILGFLICYFFVPCEDCSSSGSSSLLGFEDSSIDTEIKVNSVTVKECITNPDSCNGKKVKFDMVWYIENSPHYYIRDLQGFMVEINKESCSFPSQSIFVWTYYEFIGNYEVEGDKHMFYCTEPPIKESDQTPYE
ncbi:MAG: hypothetical protein ABH849_00670 [Nanoarchaeota archaeon]